MEVISNVEYVSGKSIGNEKGFKGQNFSAKQKLSQGSEFKHMQQQRKHLNNLLSSQEIPLGSANDHNLKWGSTGTNSNHENTTEIYNYM